MIEPEPGGNMQIVPFRSFSSTRVDAGFSGSELARRIARLQASKLHHCRLLTEYRNGCLSKLERYPQ
jgi:hypothetical protein